MIHAGIALARRLEAAEAANDADCVGAQPATAVETFAGGRAIFAGADSPLTRALGIGLEGAVPEAELAALESFFRLRGARVNIDLCPLVSPELVEMLRRRGYRPAEFAQSLVRWIAGAAPFDEDPRVERCLDAERWARVVGRGFFDQEDLSAEEMEVGLAVFRSGKSECYLASPAGGGAGAGAALSVREGTAVLFADSTVSASRRQGLHQALIRARLNSAIAQGCDLAAAVTAPGSASQRNYERLGFQVAYTKVLLVG